MLNFFSTTMRSCTFILLVVIGKIDSFKELAQRIDFVGNNRIACNIDSLMTFKISKGVYQGDEASG